MKKITRLFLLITITGILSECKKGEDDPIISLRSRKARVAGEWKLKSGYSNSSYKNILGSYNNSGSSNIYYQESSYTETTSSNNNGSMNGSTSTKPYSLAIKFEKDGNFEMTETIDGVPSISKGTWNFTGKIGEHKNKEQIVINFKSNMNPFGQIVNNSGNYTDITFNIHELRNKKMVLVSENTTEQPNYITTYQLKYVLEQ